MKSRFEAVSINGFPFVSLELKSHYQQTERRTDEPSPYPTNETSRTQIRNSCVNANQNSWSDTRRIRGAYFQPLSTSHNH